MWRLSDLINERAKKRAPYDSRKTWANDYANGVLFIVLILAGLFVTFFVPIFGLGR
jgi:hypothetical protein